MDRRVATVLAALESRSMQERPTLEILRARGGPSLRERAASLMLDVGPDVGRLLNLLVRAMDASVVVEVGGSVGYSTVWLAEAVRATSGRLYSIEIDPGKQREQRANLVAAGLEASVELTSMEAPELADHVGPIDFVLLDHWKELYVRDFDAVWPKIRAGGMVAADNMLVPAKNASIIARYRAHLDHQVDARTLLLHVGDGVEITVKVPFDCV